jgi:hypothetical protein
MARSKLGTFMVEFTHGQILVYDSSVPNPQCLWTKRHLEQGFARRESTVCFVTLLDSGEAVTTAYFGSYVENGAYSRVIAVPFFSETGRIIVSGVLEIHCARLVFVPPGHYAVYCGQYITEKGFEEDKQVVDLFFEKQKTAVTASKILLRDEGIQQSGQMLEQAEEMT